MEIQAHLIVDIARLDSDGEEIEGLLNQEILQFDDVECVKPSGPVSYRLFVQVTGTELFVKGRFDLRCTCLCSRCGCEFSQTYSEENFVESFDISSVGEYFDLTESARESIILALPAYPICKEDCKGLCLKCGADLNVNQCTCSRQTSGSCWDVLDEIKP